MKDSSRCGVFGFYPKWMKNLGTTRNFIAVYSLLGTVQSMSFVYISVTLTTIEKRFKISSRTTGIMLSGNEISQILSFVLTYFGGAGHRPRWIALGVVFSAMSCLVLSLPHFIYGPGSDALALTKEYRDNIILNSTITEKLPLCPQKGTLGQCDEDSKADVSIVPRLLIFLSQFILGIGTTLYYGLGLPYIDDNSKKKNSPMLFGATFALRTVGPTFGYMLGWACLSLYIDPSLHPVIDKNDPRWLGAWWLGWIILSVTMGMFGLLMSLFPRHPIRSKVAKKAREEMQKEEISLKEKNKPVEVSEPEEANHATLNNFPKACKRILCNKLLACNTTSMIFYILGSSAYYTFLAKYLEVQYNTAPGEGAAVSGPVIFVGTVIGFLTSGFLISKYKPKSRPLLAWNVVVAFFFCCGQIAFIIISCPAVKMQNLDLETMQINITSPCNVNCNCNSVKYNPVCHEPTMTTFFSACHAGCSKVLSDTEFGDCSCVDEIISEHVNRRDVSIIAQSQSPNLVKSGLCETNCKKAYFYFMLINCFLQILGSSGRIGNVLVNYRCVEVRDKSFAQGMTVMLLSVFALIPGPIIYGAIIDSTCLIWDQSCGTRGNCWFHDKEKFNYYVNFSAAGLIFVGAFFDAFVCYLAKDLDLYGDDDESDKRRDFIKDEIPSVVNHGKSVVKVKNESNDRSKSDKTIANEIKVEELRRKKDNENEVGGSDKNSGNRAEN